MPKYNNNKNNCAIDKPILLAQILYNTKREKYAPNSITVDINGMPYLLGELVGRGAQSCVFSVKNQPGKVIKVSKCIHNHDIQKITQEALRTEDLSIFADASAYHLKQKEDLNVPEDLDLHFMVLEDLGSDLSKPNKGTSAKAINESYQRAIKTCLALHNLYSGTASKSNTRYAHLDFKPSNIVEDSKGNVRLIDFADAQENPDGPYGNNHLVEGTPIYLPSKNVLSTCTKAQVDIIGLMRSLYIPEEFHGRDHKHQRGDAILGYVFQPLTNSTDTFFEETRGLLDTTAFSDDNKILGKNGQTREYPSALDLAVSLSLLKMRCSLKQKPFSNYKTFSPEKKKVINDMALLGCTSLDEIQKLINEPEDKTRSDVIEQSINTAIASTKGNAFKGCGDGVIQRYLPNTYAAGQYVKGKNSFNKYDLLQVIRNFSEPDTAIFGRSEKNLPESYKVVQKKLEETAKLVGVTDKELMDTLYLDKEETLLSVIDAFKAVQKDGVEKDSLREMLRQYLYQAAQNNENDKLTAIATALSTDHDDEVVSDSAGVSKKSILFNDKSIVDYLLEQLKTFRPNIHALGGVPLPGKIGSADAIEAILNSSLPLPQKLQLLSDIGRGKLYNEKKISRRSLELRNFYQGLACFEGVSPDNMTTAFTNFLKKTGQINSSVNNIEHHIQRYQLIKDGLTAIPKDSFNGKASHPETNQMGVAQTHLEALREVEFEPSAELFAEFRSVDRFLENHGAAVQNARLHAARANKKLTLDSEQPAQELSKKEQQGVAGPREPVVHEGQKRKVAVLPDSTLGLPELCNQYSSASDKKAIESAVDKPCTESDLINLRKALESFRGLTRGSSKFFKHEYLPTGMQTVVDMIDNSTVLNQSTTACEVLIKLQEVAASSSERWTFGGRNEKTAQAYEAINKFFDKNCTSAGKDINGLIEAIKQLSAQNRFYTDTPNQTIEI